MTLSAKWVDGSVSDIEIHYTAGPVTIKVEEDDMAARRFREQLGQLLANADGRTHGQHAYDAYHASSGGRSVHDEELPAWDDQDEAVREHWEAAAAAARS